MRLPVAELRALPLLPLLSHPALPEVALLCWMDLPLKTVALPTDMEVHRLLVDPRVHPFSQGCGCLSLRIRDRIASTTLAQFEPIPRA